MLLWAVWLTLQKNEKLSGRKKTWVGLVRNCAKIVSLTAYRIGTQTLLSLPHDGLPEDKYLRGTVMKSPAGYEKSIDSMNALFLSPFASAL